MSEGLKYYIDALFGPERPSVPHGTSAKKIFPKLDERVEPHIDEEQKVGYEEDEKGKTVTTLL